jgi:hypothetical protein
MLFIVVSALVGFISSYYLAAIHSRQLLVVIYHVPFRFWRPYLALYDGFENKYTYELLGGSTRFKSNRSFLDDYQALRPYATERFRKLWDAYAKHIGRDYGLVLLAALGLFWNVFWPFIVPFLVIQLIAFLRLHFIQNYRAGFFAVAMISVLFADRI